jgi:glucose/arabinose dehydrogenase
MTVESDLVLLEGARYDDPVFSWHIPIGVTDIEFFNSSKLGDRYRDNIFVGDINNGNLYFFTVNGTRTGLWFEDDQEGLLLADLVADNNGVDPSEASHELSPIVLGKGFGRITDIETGPDGFLYVLTYEDGRIYRIVGDGS